MAKEKINTKPITLKELGEFTEQVILPGVEGIVAPLESRVGKVEDKIDQLAETVKAGFTDIKKSIQVLGGDIAESKEQQKEFQEDHESRLRLVERKVSVN